jgi:hypothetical protein
MHMLAEAGGGARGPSPPQVAGWGAPHAYSAFFKLIFFVSHSSWDQYIYTTVFHRKTVAQSH